MRPLVADAAEISVRVGRDWFPVMIDDHRWQGRDAIDRAARALRAVGLGGRLQWQTVPGLLEGGILDDNPIGSWPRGINGHPWAVAIVPGSVIVFAERGDGDNPERVSIGARLRPTQPGAVIAEVTHALDPDRHVSVTGAERRAGALVVGDRDLVRQVIAQESICESPAVANVPGVPLEVLRVGATVGVAWTLPDQPAPFVIWTLAAWAIAGGKFDPDDQPAILVEAARALGVRGHVRSRRDGDPPPLEYDALLDPGERITATAIITTS